MLARNCEKTRYFPGSAGSNPVVGFLPYPPRLPHLQLDDCPELAPRWVANHHQLALDDDRRGDFEALVRLGHGEGHDTQHASPVLAAFADWLGGQRLRVLPKSPIVEAVTYTTNQ